MPRLRCNGRLNPPEGPGLSFTEPLEATPETPGTPAAQVASAGAWGLGGRVTLLVVNFVCTPFTLRLLGPAAYGLWTLLILALSWANYADIGMGSATTKYGSERFTHGDGRGESTIVWTALCLVAVTTSCVAVAVAVSAHFVVDNLLRVRGELLAPGVLALRIGCGVFVFQSVAAIFNTPQVVRLRWREFTLVISAAALVAAIGTPVALFALRGGVVTAEAVGLAAAVAWALGNFAVAVRFQPEIRRPRVTKAALKQLVAYGGALTVGGLALIPLTSAERFFLAHSQSTTVVAYYAVAVSLGLTLRVLPEQLTQPLLPGLARLEAEGRHEEHRVLYRKGLSGMFLVATPAAIMLALIAHPFISLWAGPEYGSHSTGPFLLVIAGVWFSCLGSVPYSYLLASGRTKVIAYLQTGELIPYLVLAWLLTARFGAIGAAAVWAARWAVDAVLCIAVVHRSTGWRHSFRRSPLRLPVVPFSERRLHSIGGPIVLGCTALLAARVSQDLLTRIGFAALAERRLHHICLAVCLHC